MARSVFSRRKRIAVHRGGVFTMRRQSKLSRTNLPSTWSRRPKSSHRVYGGSLTGPGAPKSWNELRARSTPIAKAGRGMIHARKTGKVTRGGRAAVGLAHGGPNRAGSWGVRAQKYLTTIPKRAKKIMGGRKVLGTARVTVTRGHKMRNRSEAARKGWRTRRQRTVFR